jgi:hypothetical protein
VTEAADQLGWKLGTFSGRLTRAKDLLLARLDARGLTAGVVIGLGLAAPPAGTVAATTALIRVGTTIPNSIIQLTRGVMTMRTATYKLLAAGILVASGLGLGAGGLPTAGAEPPGIPPGSKVEVRGYALRGQAAADPKSLADDLSGALEADYVRLLTQVKEEEPTARTKKWDYDFVEVSDLSQTKFVEFLQDRENRGWEFIGSTPMPVNGHPSAVWLFRRPRAPATAARSIDNLTVPDPRSNSNPYGKPPAGASKSGQNVADQGAAIEAEIQRLQKQLAELARKRVEVPKAELPLPPADMVPLLSKLAEKKFPTRRVTFAWHDEGLDIEGDTAAVEWAVRMIRKMAEK